MQVRRAGVERATNNRGPRQQTRKTKPTSTFISEWRRSDDDTAGPAGRSGRGYPTIFVVTRVTGNGVLLEDSTWKDRVPQRIIG